MFTKQSVNLTLAVILFGVLEVLFNHNPCKWLKLTMFARNPSIIPSLVVRSANLFQNLSSPTCRHHTKVLC